MLTARQITLWGDKPREFSAEDLGHKVSVHDRERYQRVQDIAMEILAAAAGGAVAELEPLRDTVLSHPTPLSRGGRRDCG